MLDRSEFSRWREAADGARRSAELQSQAELVDAALRRLSRHYIPARYPDAHPAGAPGMYYGLEDAEQALRDLSAILSYVDGFWSRLSATLEGAPDGH